MLTMISTLPSNCVFPQKNSGLIENTKKALQSLCIQNNKTRYSQSVNGTLVADISSIGLLHTLRLATRRLLAPSTVIPRMNTRARKLLLKSPHMQDNCMGVLESKSLFYRQTPDLRKPGYVDWKAFPSAQPDVELEPEQTSRWRHISAGEFPGRTSDWNTFRTSLPCVLVSPLVGFTWPFSGITWCWLWQWGEKFWHFSSF